MPDAGGGAAGTDVREAAHGAPEGLRVRATRGVFWVALGNWTTQLAAFVVFALLSRLLEPRAFGLVALAAVFVGLTQVVVNQGLLDALVQRKHLEREHVDTAFTMSIGAGVLLAVFLAALAQPLASVLDEPDLGPVLVGLAAGIPIASLALVPRALLTRELSFRSLSLRTIVATCVGSAVGIAAALAGLGVWSLVAQNLANQLAGTVILWSVLDRRPRFGFSRRHFRHLFGYGASIVGFQILNFFNRRLGDLLIGVFLGPVALGLYVVAQRMLVLIIEMTSNLLDQVAFPLFSRLQTDPGRLRIVYYKTSSYAALVAFPVFAGIVASAPLLVDVLFGDRWHDSAPVMRILALFGLVQALLYLNSTMLKALGKPSWRLGIVALTLALDLVVFLSVVSKGIIAVAAALAVIGCAMAPVWFLAVQRLLPVEGRTYLRTARVPAIAAAAMVISMVTVVSLTPEAPAVAGLLLTWTIGVVVYVAAVWVLAPVAAREVVSLLRRALPGGGKPPVPVIRPPEVERSQ